MSKNVENNENLSESKQRRLERAKKRADEKKARLIWRVAGIVVLVLIVGALAWSIGKNIYKSQNTVVAGNDFSAQLDDNGFIKGCVAKDNITLADYKIIVAPASEIEYSDEAVDADIQSLLEAHQVVNSETDAAIKDGDKVSIEYVGTIDGVEFEGGNTNGTPADLTIGSQQFIDGFEEQLIGAKVGDEVKVEVTFPDDYGNTELSGKDAVFMVTVDGIYETPEFTDDFVVSNYSDYASTTEEYRQYLKDKKYEENLKQYIENYLKDNSSVKSYPKAYLKNLKSTQKYTDMQTYEYMNQMYISYSGAPMYNSFDEYTGMSEADYDASLDDACKETCKEDMIYQAILETEGITLTADDYKAYYEEKTGSSESYDTLVETRGAGDTMRSLVKIKAIEIARDNAKVQ